MEEANFNSYIICMTKLYICFDKETPGNFIYEFFVEFVILKSNLNFLYL